MGLVGSRRLETMVLAKMGRSRLQVWQGACCGSAQVRSELSRAVCFKSGVDARYLVCFGFGHVVWRMDVSAALRREAVARREV